MNQKRYQVFVSSTYKDLKVERQKVVEAILQVNCFPAGMELFQASTESQRTLIKDYINACDYFIVVVGGRYGSRLKDGQSYTEWEYQYAQQRDKPVLAFLHSDPGKIMAERTEDSDEGQRQLERFRSILKQRMCSLWSTPDELAASVILSLIRIFESHPTTGWVRSDELSDDAARTMLRLHERIENLESQLKTAREDAPPGSENLAQGDQEIELDLHVIYSNTSIGDEQLFGELFAVKETWNEIFRALSPYMQIDCSQTQLRDALTNHLRRQAGADVSSKLDEYEDISRMYVDEDQFQSVLVQLRSLGLIARSGKLSDGQGLWTLTSLGDSEMFKLRSVPSGQTKFRLFPGSELEW
jgi:hypothetical protein